MMNDIFNQEHPGKTLMDILGERAKARQADKARAEADATRAAEDLATVQQQKKSDRVWRHWLEQWFQQMGDQRNGH